MFAESGEGSVFFDFIKVGATIAASLFLGLWTIRSADKRERDKHKRDQLRDIAIQFNTIADTASVGLHRFVRKFEDAPPIPGDPERTSVIREMQSVFQEYHQTFRSLVLSLNLLQLPDFSEMATKYRNKVGITLAEVVDTLIQNQNHPGPFRNLPHNSRVEQLSNIQEEFAQAAIAELEKLDNPPRKPYFPRFRKFLTKIKEEYGF